MATEVTETSVLIVGGGPIGLTAATLLAQHGIESVLVNERPTTSTHPRARFLDVRTSEILDQMGLYEAVAATGLPPEWLDSVRYSTRMDAPEVLRLPTQSYDSTVRSISPVAPIMTSQDLVEPIMKAAAESYSVCDVRFGTRLEALEDADDGGVRATVRHMDSNAASTIEAQWVIGADGRGSAVRDLGGFALDEGVIGSPVQDVLFHADISPWVGDRKGALLFVYHPLGYGLFQPLNGIDRWRAQCTTFTPPLAPEEVTEEHCVAWIRSAIGDDDAAMVIDVLGIAPWMPEERLAGCWRGGPGDRVLLAGDAAHTIFPTGGYGMNLGYHGIHNLAWKLAAVIRGDAGAELLDTYEQERRPQVELTLATATENARRAGAMYRAALGGGDIDSAVANLMQYGNFDGMILSTEYLSPLCQPETGVGPAVENPIHDFVPSVRAGRRAPHSLLPDGGSVLSEFGSDYVLLVPDEAVGPWRRTAVRTAPMPPGEPYRRDEVVLVRPDGVVAGRWPAAADHVADMMQFA